VTQTPADVAVDALAVARLVHLLQQDEVWPILELREAFERRAHGSRWLDLSTCPYCLSMWVAAGVAVARAVAPRPWSWAARALAASYVTGKLEDL
jgi:hypothetical protein